MKKLGFIVASTLLLAACTSSGDENISYEEYEDTSIVENTENLYEDIENTYELTTEYVAWPQRGIWNGNLYLNEYLGVSFEMPEGWDKLSDEQISEQLGVGISFLQGSDAIEFIMEEIGFNSFMEMMATNPETGASINIAFERLENPYMTAREFIFHASEELVAAGMEVFLDGFHNIIIGNSSWEVYGSMADFGVYIYGRFLVSVYGGFVRVITIVYTEHSETAEEILSMISEVF